MPDKEELLWFTLDIESLGERKALLLSWLAQLSSGFHSPAQPSDKVFTGPSESVPGWPSPTACPGEPSENTEEPQRGIITPQLPADGISCRSLDACSALGVPAHTSASWPRAGEVHVPLQTHRL